MNCPLCGQPVMDHDEAACDEKMANWRPTGLIALIKNGASSMRQDDLDGRAGLPAAIWFTPRADGVQASLSVEMHGGPKRFLRVWLDFPPQSGEWGWTLHRTALKLWPTDAPNDVT